MVRHECLKGGSLLYLQIPRNGAEHSTQATWGRPRVSQETEQGGLLASFIVVALEEARQG